MNSAHSLGFGDRILLPDPNVKCYGCLRQQQLSAMEAPTRGFSAEANLASSPAGPSGFHVLVLLISVTSFLTLGRLCMEGPQYGDKSLSGLLVPSCNPGAQLSFMSLSSPGFQGHQLPGAQGSADHHISWTHRRCPWKDTQPRLLGDSRVKVGDGHELPRQDSGS